MGKGLLVGIVVIVLIAIGIFAFSGNNENVDLEESLDNVQRVPAPGNENVDEMIVNEDSNNEVKTHVIEMSANGFSPSELKINSGDIVQFKAIDNSNRWPASNNHPTHTLYPKSGLSKCFIGDREGLFDACESVKQGESFTFTFNEVGTWGYHDHLDTGKGGEIIVG